MGVFKSGELGAGLLERCVARFGFGLSGRAFGEGPGPLCRTAQAFLRIDIALDECLPQALEPGSFSNPIHLWHRFAEHGDEDGLSFTSASSTSGLRSGVQAPTAATTDKPQSAFDPSNRLCSKVDLAWETTVSRT